MFREESDFPFARYRAFALSLIRTERHSSTFFGLCDSELERFNLRLVHAFPLELLQALVAELLAFADHNQTAGLCQKL